MINNIDISQRTNDFIKNLIILIISNRHRCPSCKLFRKISELIDPNLVNKEIIYSEIVGLLDQRIQQIEKNREYNEHEYILNMHNDEYEFINYIEENIEEYLLIIIMNISNKNREPIRSLYLLKNNSI